MKRLTAGFLLLLMLALVALPAFADSTYVDVDDTFCDSDGAYLACHGTFSMGADSTGTFFTPEIHIANANADTGWVRAVVLNNVGTENIDLFAEYSFDNHTWYSVSAAVVTDIGTTAKLDTLGVVNGVKPIEHLSASYLRLRFVGQNDNNDGGIVSWAIYLPKRAGASTGFRALQRSN